MSLTASPAEDTAAPARRPHAGALSTSTLRHAGDDRLVALTRGGSERAFAEIMRRYQRPLQFYCMHMVGAPRAEDAVQQAFMQAFVALRDGERREIALRPWLYRIARNCAIDLLRKQPFDHDQLDPDFDGVAQPPGVLEQKEELARIVAAIQALPERQRRALTLRELEGRSYGEISAELGHTDSGVRQLIFRARTALRNLGAFILPLGSIRWRLIGAPSSAAAADPHQIAVAATVSSGSSNIVQAAVSVVVGTLALLGPSQSQGAHHRDRAAVSAGLRAAPFLKHSAAAGSGAVDRRSRGGRHRATAAAGEDGGSEAFFPAPAAASDMTAPSEPAIVAAAGDQQADRAAPEESRDEQPEKLEALDSPPDASSAPSGTTGASDPVPESGGGGGAATPTSAPGPASQPTETPTSTKKPTPPKPPTPPRLNPPKQAAPKKPVPPKAPAAPKSAFFTTAS